MYESLVRAIIQEEIRSLMTDEALFRKKHVHGDANDEESGDIYVDQCDSCDGYHIKGACPLSKNNHNCEICGGNHDTDAHDNSCPECGENNCKKHHTSSYMAKPQMFQISRDANSIYDMLEDDEQLEDWMESKIAQASRDISSIHDSLSYRKRR